MEKTIFTKRNKVVKSVTFELKPVGKTRETLSKKGVIESDCQLKEYAAEAKAVGDAFYRDFFEHFGNNMQYDWEELKDAFDSRKESDSYIKLKEKMIAKIAKDAAASLQEYINEYSVYVEDGKTACKPNTSAFVDTILYTYAGREKDKGFEPERMQAILKLLRRTTSTTFKRYFVGWNKIINGTGCGSCAYRTLENFEIFCLNLNAYIAFKEQYPAEAATFEMTFDANKLYSFNGCFGQTGIDAYNEIISGKFSEDGKKLAKGINEIINELGAQNSDVKLRYLSKMKKQILTVDKALFIIESIQTNEELYELLLKAIDIEKRCTGNLSTIFREDSSYDFSRMYIGGNKLNTLSNEVFGEWDILRNAVLKRAMRSTLDKKVEKTGKAKAKLTQKEETAIINNIVKDDYAISLIDEIISDNGGASNVFLWATNMSKKLIHAVEEKRKILLADYFWHTNKKPNDDSVTNIRIYLESVTEINRFSKLFSVKNNELILDYDFYGQLNLIIEDLDKLNKVYNMTRNFLTKKNADKVERTQLCFGKTSHFEQAWQNKDLKNNTFGNTDAALLERNGRYYYLVPSAGEGKRKNKLIISDIPYDGDNYAYLTTTKALKLSMAVPRVTFKSMYALSQYNAGVEDEFAVQVGNGTMMVSKEMYENYNNATFRSSKSELIKLIDFYKDFLSLHPSYNGYDFSFLRPSEDYANLGEFCSEVDAVTYQTRKRYLDAAIVDKAVEEGELYLFMIVNQDMYKEEEQCKDVTALYFRKLMDSMNTECPKILVNNCPAIYYREPVVAPVDKHPVGSILVNKRTKDGRYIPGNVYMEICDYLNHNTKSLSEEAKPYFAEIVYRKSDRPHVKDMHYTREMFTITLSYTINADVSKVSSAYDLNKKVRSEIRGRNINILSVVRGYNSLLYYIITDSEMNIRDKGPLNVIGNTDFYDKLKVLGKERRADQLKWKYEKAVASIKDTYLGMVAAKIVKLAVENDAIICIENISDREKDKKSAFDASVYKKFEGKLVDKLSCYVDRTIRDNEPGGLLNPLQLATKECKGFHNGILFYINPVYTKNVEPVSGFVNLLDVYNIKSITAKKQFLSKLNAIRYNQKEDFFEFSFCYADLDCKLDKDEIKQYIGLEKLWTIQTRYFRMKKDKGTKLFEKILGTNLLKEYFDSIGLKYQSGNSIDIELLPSEGICLLFDVFTTYANGFVPRGKEQPECSYFSPVCAWSSLCEMTFDEMSAYNLATKGMLTFKLMQDEDDAKAKNYLGKMEWLNYLFNISKDF